MEFSNGLPPTRPSRQWFKRPWFIVLVLLVISWFGLPWALSFFGAESTETSFTNAPGLQPSLTDAPRSRLETADDPTIGSPVAPVVIVEFGDFQCPFCRAAAPIIKQVMSRYPEAVKLIYRDFPVAAIHSEAVGAAEAANCAHRQGAFWAYHDALFAQQAELSPELYLALAKSLRLESEAFERCLEQHLTLSEIQADFAEGIAAGVSGTPTWFVNGRKIEGALTLELWDKVIVNTLKNEFTSPGTP